MTVISMKEKRRFGYGDTHTQREDDHIKTERRDWSDAATSQRTPRLLAPDGS